MDLIVSMVAPTVLSYVSFQSGSGNMFKLLEALLENLLGVLYNYLKLSCAWISI